MINGYKGLKSPMGPDVVRQVLLFNGLSGSDKREWIEGRNDKIINSLRLKKDLL
jgi:hypothetical protein